jgi:hypothetical protein
MSIGRDWVRAFADADAVAVGKLCATDLKCDLNVPEWRFWLSGAEAVADFLAAEEFHEGYRVTYSEVRDTEDGAVIEIETRFRHGGEECMTREVHLLRAGPDGVNDLTVYCTGIWDAATIERHAREVVPAP